MSSADLATVVIACPNCGTRYQVPYGAVGAAGRDVQCAQCGKSWHATAEAPLPEPAATPAPAPPAIALPAEEEDALDAAFEMEAEAVSPPKPAAAPDKPVDEEYERTLAEIRAAIAPKRKPENSLDPALLTKTQREFDKRQHNINRKLPIARLRRTARLAALVSLMSLLLLGFSLRTDLVSWFPQLAGLYAAIGLPVNVVGLEFQDAKTLTSLREGKTVMQVTARIRSTTNATVTVPPVLVSLLDTDGKAVYEWTVAPQIAEMNPGEVMDFLTEVNAPPASAVTVRLSFTNPGGVSAPLPPKAS